MANRQRNAYCSFCRKSHRDAGPLVEGPGDVYICEECVELCQSIIAQEKARRQYSPPAGEQHSESGERLEKVKIALTAAISGAMDQLSPSEQYGVFDLCMEIWEQELRRRQR